MMAPSDETAPPLAPALVRAAWAGRGRWSTLSNGPASGAGLMDRRAFIGNGQQAFAGEEGPLEPECLRMGPLVVGVTKEALSLHPALPVGELGLVLGPGGPQAGVEGLQPRSERHARPRLTRHPISASVVPTMSSVAGSGADSSGGPSSPSPPFSGGPL